MTSALNLAKLTVVCGGITGRKKIQKIVHLLQTHGFHDQFSYDFGYLHYGPYSHGVKADLDLLVDEKLIEEKEDRAGEHPTYRYEPRENLNRDLTGVGIEETPVWSEMAKKLNEFTPQRLEAASTIAYLRDCGFEADRLRTRFEELKPSLIGERDNATMLLRELSTQLQK